MTREEMKHLKDELGLTSEMIAAASGVPLSTVQKIMSGNTKAPRRNTMKAIEDALRREAALQRRESEAHCGMTGMVRETAPAYNTSSRKRRYTIEDYYALPDERRVELIDGQFYDMAAPAVIHQKILGELYLLFRECADAHAGTCEVFLSPCDVRLDKDNYTMVQPDLLLLCRQYDLGARAIEGAPDLAVEILSPSTRAKDMLLKLYKYQNAGVREYWIVDPDAETVLVYDFRDDNLYPDKYDFDSIIPIQISDGECSIDFSRVQRALRRTRERSE